MKTFKAFLLESHVPSQALRKLILETQQQLEERSFVTKKLRSGALEDDGTIEWTLPFTGEDGTYYECCFYEPEMAIIVVGSNQSATTEDGDVNELMHQFDIARTNGWR